MVESLFSKLIYDLLKQVVQKNVKGTNLMKWLKTKGLSDLNSNFETVYVHALVEYAQITNLKQLSQLFAFEDVIQAFKNEVYGVSNYQEALFNTLTAVLHTSQKKEILALKQHNIQNKDILHELHIFTEIFNKLTHLSQNLNELKLHNLTMENKHLLQKLTILLAENKYINTKEEVNINRIFDLFDQYFDNNMPWKNFKDLSDEVSIQKIFLKALDSKLEKDEAFRNDFNQCFKNQPKDEGTKSTHITIKSNKNSPIITGDHTKVIYNQGAPPPK